MLMTKTRSVDTLRSLANFWRQRRQCAKMLLRIARAEALQRVRSWIYVRKLFAMPLSYESGGKLFSVMFIHVCFDFGY